MSSPAATVVISTKNRREDLKAAVASCMSQTADLETLVIDDGSTDGTADMIRSEFPRARLERFEQSGGYIARRNLGARLARGAIVFSLDDDAVFPSPNTVQQTLAEFSTPRIGAIAIPYIDVKIDPAIKQKAPDDRAIYIVAEFRGTAHALRRDVFLGLGGYREVLTHQTEEGDYCARMINAGYLVRAGLADPIHHLESPKRDLTRQLTFNARNNLLYHWHNVPTRFLPRRMAGTGALLLRHGAKLGYTKATIKGMGRAFGDIARGRVKRQPISLKAYSLIRYLRHHEPAPLSNLDAMLPELVPVEHLKA